MKKASYILLAMMLIIAVFVSCKAEVIDDSDLLVNVTFSSDDNSKGLTWSRDFAPENYYWSYDASKADNGPRTGTATKAKVGGDEGKGLNHDVGPFSVGTWNFTLYGYTGTDRKKLVYEGHAQASLAKGSSNPVKVNVSSKEEQAGTILVSKDIRLTDGTNTTYVPTHVTIMNAKDSSIAKDIINGNSLENIQFDTSNEMSYEVESGSYVVTIELRNEDGSVVYSSTQIYINVYDYQSTRIGGSLDDVKVATRFEAANGTIIGTSDETTVEASGSTTLIVKGVTPINSGDTTVEFPQGSLGSDASKVTLKVVAYPTSVAKGFSVKDGNGVPVVGIDLSVFIGDQSKEEFGDYVTVSTFVTKNLTSKTITSETAIGDREGFNLFYNGSEAEDKQPTLVSYDPETGELIFKTNHFSLFYVASSSPSVVAINETTGVAYKSLKAAVGDVAGSGYITLLQDVEDGDGILIPEGNKTLTIDFNKKKYTAFEKKDSSNSTERNAFEFRKGNSIKLKNGTLTTAQKYNVTLIKNYSDLSLENFEINGYIADNLYAISSLSCNYGTTLITGNTVITGSTQYNSNALEVCYLFTDGYKEGVSVSFEDSFSGKVSGAVYFNLGSDNDTSDYSHELVIESGNFSDAKFILPYAGNSSSFKVNKKAVGEGLSFVGNHYPVVEDGDYWVLDRTKAVVLNKTTGVVYEELGRAINNSSNGQVLVLQKDITMQSAIANPFNSKSVTIDLNGKAIGVSDSVSKEILTIASGSVTIEDSSNGSGRLNKPIESFFKVSVGKLVINGGSFVSDPTAYVDKSTHDVAYSVSNKTWIVTSKN